ncbi:sulfatase-like hydrolase/transferase [bacterium]|nr:sulfatase-like hydrolase/transferase [bacterium]
MPFRKHVLPFLAILLFAIVGNAADRPNILWIFQEDTSPWMGCYGDKVNKDWTPRIDKMATEGVRFSRAFVPFPVCSACRSSMAVGANAIRFGAHEHRSRRGKTPTYLPEGLKTIAELMREADYFTFNVGKTDYNFAEAGKGIYSTIPKANNKTPWRERPDGKNFFGQIQLKGGKTNTKNWPAEKKTDPASVTVPADYPQNDLYRETVAQHYDAIRSDDAVIGGILDRLKTDGLMDSTIVIYFSDHGANNLIRHKQMPTEGGLHVPFIVQGPKKWVPNAGTVRKDLINTLDLTATSFAWAGIPIPKWCEGQDLFARNFTPRKFIGGAKDRLDHTIDRVRTIRTDRYRYTKNYFLDRVFLQPQYRDSKPYVIDMRKAYADGSLDPKLAEIYFGERPAEELYDVIKDPAQVNNLANDSKFAKTLRQHRSLLKNWLAKGDMGEGNEPDQELIQNGEKTKWGIGVNYQYERIREDSDGDGLSDTWEEQNNRDPKDGKLLFTFDCGGWQTEGWKARGKVTNIAGHQGFLDFDLISGKASLQRNELKLSAAKNQGALTLKMHCTADTAVKVTANGKVLGVLKLKKSEEFKSYEIPLKNSTWKGTIKNLRLDFSADKGTTVGIDWIKVN